ncbi:MAG: 2,3,4,5-tetrahydropyridine-2,6-dicarboxylate N-succinyltransferase [Chloroflexota bacterium]
MSTVAVSVLDELASGRIRAAWPDSAAPDGWRVDHAAKKAILGCFADRATRTWEVGPLNFRDRVGVPPKSILGAADAAAADAAGRPWRIVPGGTSIREGAHLEPGVVVMPPSFINIGAWIGEDAMVDSHVLVGSCAQIGARVHLGAGVQIGGVLEPPGARPVIVEDDAFVGAGAILLDGILVRGGAVVAAGVTLTGASTIYDTVRETVIRGTSEEPAMVPSGAVVIPGTRQIGSGFGALLGLAQTIPLIVKYRDAGTDRRVALEEALR